MSTFGESPGAVGPEHLAPLIKHALSVVPEDDVEETPFFLLATAGVRLLPEVQRKELLKNICSYVRSETDFLLPDCDLHIQVIPGETEGLYGWIAANYLLGGFDEPESHNHGKDHHTYGFLDMGGASAQIAFAPNATEAKKHANDLKLMRLRTVDGQASEYQVFVTTWLGFGANEARRRYIEALAAGTGNAATVELPDPCLPSGLTTDMKGKLIEDGSPDLKVPHLLGTGEFEECLRQTFPLLDKDKPCMDEPCLINGVHVPAIDFDVNHFIGISEYWHTTHEIFEFAHKDKAYDFNTYQARVKEFCSQDWEAIEKGVLDHTWGKKVDAQTAYEVCFKASWIINILHDGIGIPRVGLEETKGSGHNGTKEVLKQGKEKGYLDPFQAVNKIDSTEISWTLGKMVLYASSQIKPLEGGLPVGFGSNTAGIPADFQYPSAKHDHEDFDDDGDDDWHDKLFSDDSPRRIPGFIFFLFMFCMIAFFLLGRERRARILQKFTGGSGSGSATSKGRRRFLGSKLNFLSRNTPVAYDRVLEDGAAADEFELGDMDSSDGDHSDTSDHSRTGHSSGWATPRLKVGFENNGSSTDVTGLGLSGMPLGKNPMDRSGLIVRTESRESLVHKPGVKRSKTASPSRGLRPSPMASLASLAED